MSASTNGTSATMPSKVLRTMFATAPNGWDEEIKGGLIKLSAEQLAVQMGLSRKRPPG